MLPEWNGVYHQGVWAAWQQFCCKLELCKRQQTLFDKSKRTREFFLNRWWFEFQTAGKHAIKLRCAQTGQPLCPWWWHQWFLVDRDNANMLQLVFNKEMGLSCSRNRDYRPIYGNSWVNEWMSWIGTWFSGPAITGPLASKRGGYPILKHQINQWLQMETLEIDVNSPSMDYRYRYQSSWRTKQRFAPSIGQPKIPCFIIFPIQLLYTYFLRTPKTNPYYVNVW